MFGLTFEDNLLRLDAASCFLSLASCFLSLASKLTRFGFGHRPIIGAPVWVYTMMSLAPTLSAALTAEEARDSSFARYETDRPALSLEKESLPCSESAAGERSETGRFWSLVERLSMESEAEVLKSCSVASCKIHLVYTWLQKPSAHTCSVHRAYCLVS